jgi:hypothetical protein
MASRVKVTQTSEDVAPPATKKRRPGTTTKGNPAGLPLCICGCGEPTSRLAIYRPGHDARHASIVGAAINERRNLDLGTDASPDADISDLLAPLSEPLRAKALAKATRLGAVNTVQMIDGEVS